MTIRSTIALLFTIVLAALGILSGCSADKMASPNDHSPQHPPRPSIGSIIPLRLGNEWTYSQTSYDSSGGREVSRRELNLSLPAEFGITRTDSLLPITWDNYRDTFPGIVFKYEWNRDDSGSLVSFREDGGVPRPGLYFMGRYKYGSITRFATPRLWIAYPAQVGEKWMVAPDSGVDSTDFHTMEVIAKNATFYFPGENVNNGSSLTFVDSCYLFKEVTGSLTGEAFYYYNRHIGAVGFLYYLDGMLRTSYILKRYALGG